VDTHPATPPSAPPGAPEPRPAALPEPRQRWRLTVCRAADAPALPQRETFVAWDTAVAESGLPVVVGDPAKPKPRIVFGAPLTVGMASEGELLEIVLLERLPAWQVREALAPRIPPGWTLLDLADVWLGGPALAGRVAVAEYRITLAGAADGAAVDTAAHALLAARSLPRERAKGDAMVAYDLRPLLADIQVTDPGPPVTIRVRTRFHAELGTGRPEEVVAALAAAAGTPLTIDTIVRAGLLLAEDVT
jgi:radical SAM-linked protein